MGVSCRSLAYGSGDIPIARYNPNGSPDVPTGWEKSTPDVNGVGTVVAAARGLTASDGSRTMTLVVRLDGTQTANQVITGTVNVGSAVADVNMVNNAATVRNTISSDHAVCAGVSNLGQVMTGELATFSVCVKNNNPMAAQHTVVATLLVNASFESATGVYTYSVINRTVTWHEVNLGVGLAESYKIVVRATPSDLPLHVSASVVGLVPDSTPADNTASTTSFGYPAGLVSNWKAEGTAVDALGNNNGNLVKGPSSPSSISYAAGYNVGSAFNLDGDDYVSISDSPTLQTSSMTAGARFYTSSFSSVSFILDKVYGASLNSYVMWFDSGSLRAGITSAEGNFHWIQFSFTPLADTWYSSAMSYDADSGTLNSIPTITHVASSVTVNESQIANRTGTVNDMDGLSTCLIVTSNIGQVQLVGGNIGSAIPGQSRAWTWTYNTNDGPIESQNVTISVNDGRGGISTTTFPLVVNNVAPTATISNNGPVNEGSPVTVTLSGGTDVSSADRTAGLKYFFSTAQSDRDLDTYASAGSTNSQNFTFNDNGTYTVYARILDKDGGFTDYSTVVTVNNVNPVATINGAPATSPEGTAINLTSTVTDAGTADTFTYAWRVTKNGVAYGTPGTAASYSYTPNDNGTYTVTLTVTDDDTGSVTTTALTTVTNVAPTLVISGATNTNEGSSYSLTLGSVTDPGTDTVSSYIVNWGDGLSNTYTTNGAKNHIYADGSNTRAITVNLIDEDGTFLNRANAFNVLVDNVAPMLAISGPSVVNQGTPYVLGLASSDPGLDTIQSWIINWGDGTTQTVSGNPSSVQHTYAVGVVTYSISATATDEDGTFQANSLAVTVNGINALPAVIGAGCHGPALIINGSDAADIIRVVPQGQSAVKVLINGTDRGTFALSSFQEVVIYGKVHDDGVEDILTGSSGRDWFFANLDSGVLDRITDLKGDERTNEID